MTTKITIKHEGPDTHNVKQTQLASIVLTYGAHSTREDGVCAEEAVALLAGLGHTDSPPCASPVLIALGQRLNDSGWSSNAARTAAIAPYLLPQIGTAGDGLDQRRAYALADVAVREIAPEALDAAGLHEHAATLRALAPIVDQATARAAGAAAVAAGAAAGAAARAAVEAAGAAGDAEDAWAAARAAVEAGDAVLTRWTARLFTVALGEP